MTLVTTDPTNELSQFGDRPAGRLAITRSPLRHALQGAWAVSDQALFALSNFALNLLLARWMSPRDYGAFGVAFSIFLLLGVLHTAFFTEPMLVHGPSDRYRHKFGGYLKVLVGGHFLFSLAAALTLLAASIGLGRLGQPALSASIMGLAFMSPLVFLLWLGRRACYVLLLPRLAASGGILYMCILLGGVAVLSRQQSLSPVAAFGVMGAGSLVSSVWLLHRVLALGGAHESVARASVAQDHFEYGRWAAPSSVLYWATGSAPLLLLPLWGGYEAVAMLKALLNLIMPALHALSALSVLLVPNLVRFKGASELRGLMKLALVAFLTAGAAYALPLMVFGQSILHWAYVGKYDAAARWLPLLALLPILSGVSYVFGGALRAANRPDLVFRAQAGSAATALILAVPLLRHGDTGGAVLLLLIAIGVDAGLKCLAGRSAISAG